MTVDFQEDIPAALRNIALKPLFVLRLTVRPLQIVGGTPGGFRRVGIVPSGSFTGARLSGAVLEGGNDWQSVRADGSTLLDVRLVLKTHDDELIAMSYRGIRHGPTEIIAQLENGAAVEPSAYYFRIAPLFETSSQTYGWLNKITAIGTGYRAAEGPVYSVFEVL